MVDMINSGQVYCMLASSNLNLNETVWFYLIKPGSRHILLLILDDCGDELARKEFGANPSFWDMDSPAKNTIDPLVTAGDLLARDVQPADKFLQTLNDLEVTVIGYASY